jgi:dTDP-4-dehydrorhamnose reductase
LRIFVTGHKGQLGKALLNVLNGTGHTMSGGDLPEWQMTQPEHVDNAFQQFQPDVVIHCAALTGVDYCAEHPEEAVQVNGVGTFNVALACRRIGALLVAISTNEVFDGTAAQPYQEYDTRHPVNPYGYSKYVAEQVIERFAPEYMIVRTSWLFAPGGTNFIHKIITRAREGEELRVVTDEIGSPTYAVDLAQAVVRLIETRRPGIYHLTNTGYCSRYEFAEAILQFAGVGTAVTPIQLRDFQRPSTPPPFAPLMNIFGAAAGVTLRPWQEALREYIDRHESAGNV